MGEMVGNVVDVPGRTINPARISWTDGRISSVEPVTTTEAAGKPFLMPGFVDAHVHVESSMLPPAEFARLASAHGTLASVSDPHEIANVCGLAGVEFMLEEAAKSPLHFCFGAPSCVPATAHETSGAELNAEDVAALLARPGIGYLAEVMNFPGVLAGDTDLMEKIRAARLLGKPVDGHSPGLRGEALARYVAAGISSDHECSTLDEAREKCALGMKILIREGSAARNFSALLPIIGEASSECMFCSDDKHPDALLAGHINRLVAAAVAAGFPVFDVLRMACLHPVEHYRLPAAFLRFGDPADFIVVSDLKEFLVESSWIGGRCIARDGESRIPKTASLLPNAFHARTLTAGDFAVPARGTILRTIDVQEGELLTREGFVSLEDGERAVDSDTSRDVLKIAVVNRYRASPPSVAFVRNTGLRRGAMASSVAHDSHNIVAIGTNDRDLCRAVNLLMESRGGCVAVDGDESLLLPLPIAGLMSDLSGREVAQRYSELTAFVRRMGSTLEAPFMTLSFLALLVIPELKLSDRGLFDGRSFEFVPLFQR
ncbi:MAG: adenine deaminase [Terrimicrobiaceae bacterium]